jgi:hypothetical protein
MTRFMLELITTIMSILNFNTRELGCFAGSTMDSDIISLRPLFLLRIRSVRLLDATACSEPLVWLFSSAWDAAELTLEVDLICPFVAIDPTD